MTGSAVRMSPRSPFAELTASSTKELTRNPKLVVSLLFAFVFILILCIGLDAVLPVPFLRDNLGMILAMGVMSIAFMGTTVPIVTLRQRGTLRLFGTAPVSRITFIAAQLPARLALAVAEGIVVLALALFFGRVDALDALRFLVTVLIGSIMLLAFGFLFAARARNAELATQLTGFVPVVVLATSGTAFPREVYPDAVWTVFQLLPTTWFMQSVNADLNGATPFLPEPVLWAMMAVVAVAAAVVAARVFVWDDGDR